MKLLKYISAFCLLLLCCNRSTPLTIYYSIEEGIDVAKKEDKFIFIAFDLYISNVDLNRYFEDSDIQDALRDFVVVRLLCDDKKVINDSTTIGSKNSDFQTRIFEKYYQPMFAFISKEGRKMSEPRGYCSKNEELVQYINDFKAVMVRIDSKR
jgi:hypothetical protein